MDDDWDNPSPILTSSVSHSNGKSFGGGRGFISKRTEKPGGDNWASNGDWNGGGNAETDNAWVDSDGDRGWGGSGDNAGGSGDFGERRGRGRGGRGGRGGGGRGRGRGGGRGGGSRNRDGDDDDDNANGGGRRGGGGGGGGWGDNGGQNGENKDEKPREIYIPPERTNDENELFSGITTGINFLKFDEIDVSVTGEKYQKPITTFEDAGFRPLVLENVKKSGYTKPTPVQKYAIPIIMAKRDLMACAQTGSGKTAAFLLPIINTLLEEKVEVECDGQCAQPQVVIISPTRELAIQIYDQARKFSHNSVIKTVIIYGGTSTQYQRSHVQKGCHILVATPGRLNDFVKRGYISFASTKYVVLDEADRMLDMGFIPAVEELMDNENMAPTGTRQTLMFSATFPEEIQRIAAKFLDNYIFVTVGIVGSASTDIEQIFHKVDKFQKRNKLLEILQEDKSEQRTLVFVETKRLADFIGTYLCESKIRATSIHGDRLQRERETALSEFKKGIRNVLVATGVAARGLDIPNVMHVINFDLPKSIDEYVHRIGRTGRVGNRGKATSFFDESQDGPLAGALARILKQANQDVPPWLKGGSGGDYSNSQFGGSDIRGGDFGNNAAQDDEPLEDWS